MSNLIHIMRTAGALIGARHGAIAGAGVAVVVGLAAASSDAAPLRIMALGDSITAGVDSSTGAGYRGPLQQMLRDAGVEHDFVGTNQSGPGTFGGAPFDADHQGYSGYQADDLRLSQLPDHVSSATSLKRQLHSHSVFADLAAAGSAPDVILLHIGTNTISRDDSSSADDSFINSAHLQLGRLLDYLAMQICQGYLSSDVSIIVARIIPKISGNTHTAREDYYLQTQNYNSAIDGIVAASELASRITIADMFNGITWGVDTDGDGIVDTANGDYMTAGGIHPNDAGYAFIAQQWFEAMRLGEHLPEPGALALMLGGGLAMLARRRRGARYQPS